jgi:hypothetical protein
VVTDQGPSLLPSCIKGNQEIIRILNVIVESIYVQYSYEIGSGRLDSPEPAMRLCDDPREC